MPTYAPPAPTYELPTAGFHSAVCVDFVDDGMKATQFGEKHKVKYVFQLDEKNSRGYRHTITAWFNLSMHEKSTLRKFLGKWRGKALTDEEVNTPPGFDLEKVIGVPCVLNIVHNEGTGGKIYANIDGITPHSQKFGDAIKPEGYTREEERVGNNGTGSAPESSPEPDLSDDDIPF
ncbi:MAG TPA: hypothetical protein VN256_12975 [Pyrinomonadaceae bacterium]|nr:hypothetical protein [Pyrinomonadaceae bacterium]